MADPTAADIAEQLRDALPHGAEAFLTTLHGHMADQVDLAHIPPAPGDGVGSRDALLAQFRGLVGAIHEFRLEGAVTANGDEISFAMTMSGVDPDGNRLSVTDPAVYTVAGGRIVASRSWPPPDAADTMARLLSQAPASP